MAYWFACVEWLEGCGFESWVKENGLYIYIFVLLGDGKSGNYRNSLRKQRGVT